MYRSWTEEPNVSTLNRVLVFVSPITVSPPMIRQQLTLGKKGANHDSNSFSSSSDSLSFLVPLQIERSTPWGVLTSDNTQKSYVQTQSPLLLLVGTETWFPLPSSTHAVRSCSASHLLPRAKTSSDEQAWKIQSDLRFPPSPHPFRTHAPKPIASAATWK